MFDERALRDEIVKQWGRYGAHVEVYDMLLNRIKVLEEVRAAAKNLFERQSDGRFVMGTAKLNDALAKTEVKGDV